MLGVSWLRLTSPCARSPCGLQSSLTPFLLYPPDCSCALAFVASVSLSPRPSWPCISGRPTSPVRLTRPWSNSWRTHQPRSSCTPLLPGLLCLFAASPSATSSDWSSRVFAVNGLLRPERACLLVVNFPCLVCSAVGARVVFLVGGVYGRERLALAVFSILTLSGPGLLTRSFCRFLFSGFVSAFAVKLPLMVRAFGRLFPFSVALSSGLVSTIMLWLCCRLLLLFYSPPLHCIVSCFFTACPFALTFRLAPPLFAALPSMQGRPSLHLLSVNIAPPLSTPSMCLLCLPGFRLIPSPLPPLRLIAFSSFRVSFFVCPPLCLLVRLLLALPASFRRLASYMHLVWCLRLCISFAPLRDLFKRSVALALPARPRRSAACFFFAPPPLCPFWGLLPPASQVPRDFRAARRRGSRHVFVCLLAWSSRTLFALPPLCLLVVFFPPRTCGLTRAQLFRPPVPPPSLPVSSRAYARGVAPALCGSGYRPLRWRHYPLRVVVHRLPFASPRARFSARLPPCLTLATCTRVAQHCRTPGVDF